MTSIMFVVEKRFMKIVLFLMLEIIDVMFRSWVRVFGELELIIHLPHDADNWHDCGTPMKLPLNRCTDV